MHQLLARWDESRGGWMICSQMAYEGLIPQPFGSFPASSTNQFVMINAAGWQTMSTMLQTLSWTFKVCFLLRFFAWSQSFGVFERGFKASSLTLSKGKQEGRFPFFFPVPFHHVEVQIPRKAIAIAWSLELPKSLYVHAVHVTRRFGRGTRFRWKSEGQNRWHRSHSLDYIKPCVGTHLFGVFWGLYDVDIGIFEVVARCDIPTPRVGMGALMGTPSCSWNHASMAR